MEIRSKQGSPPPQANVIANRLDEKERLAREARQAQSEATRAQQARNQPPAESARVENERRPPTVNAQGQKVGTRVNTTA